MSHREQNPEFALSGFLQTEIPNALPHFLFTTAARSHQ